MSSIEFLIEGEVESTHHNCSGCSCAGAGFACDCSSCDDPLYSAGIKNQQTQRGE
jgi:hypothetical protein